MSHTMTRFAQTAIVAAFAVTSFTSLASAQSPRAEMQVTTAQGDTQKMTCGQSAAMVKSKGNVVLKSGPYHFDMYHRSGAVCASERDSLQPAFVRTKDNALCFIGFTCEPEDYSAN